MNCDNMRGCCSPCSQLAQQLEETNTRAVQAYNLAAAALTNPIMSSLTINGSLQVNGDILQNGAAYEAHAEKVYTNDDYIVMRDNAVSALGPGDYSGFQVKKYDGTNDGRLVIDNTGTARVGDVGDEQPLATRDESADLTDGHLVKWNAATQKLIDAGKTIDDFVASWEGRPGYETSNLVYVMYDGSDTVMGWTNTTAANLKFAVYHENGELYVADPVHNRDAANKQYVDDAIAGIQFSLSWTKRTANNDWTDMFEVSGNSMTAKKNIWISYVGTAFRGDIFIPKGYQNNSYMRFSVNTPLTPANGSDTIDWCPQLVINSTDVPNTVTQLSSTKYSVQFTIDNGAIKLVRTSSPITFNKSALTIYTAD